MIYPTLQNPGDGGPVGDGLPFSLEGWETLLAGWARWAEPFLAILAGTAVVVLLAAGWARRQEWGMRRRAVWRLAFVALAVLLLLEVTGLGPALRGWGRTRPTPAASRPDTAAHPQATRPDDRPALVPGLVWFGGSLILYGRLALGHVLLRRLGRRLVQPPHPPLRAAVTKLTRLLGCPGLRVGITPGLRGPMVFGVRRPTLVLPAAFAEAFTPDQQRAVLAHELGHLAAHDPAWQLLAEVVTAALWWHPLAWWARRQLVQACEAAADEVTLAVPDGPGLLAESLVALGRRLVEPTVPGSLAAAGSRSPLNRRVEVLLRLADAAPPGPPSRCRRACQALAPVGLVVVALAVTGWLRPVPAAETGWARSPLGLAWAWWAPPPAAAAEPEQLWSGCPFCNGLADGTAVAVVSDEKQDERGWTYWEYVPVPGPQRTLPAAAD